MCLYLINRLLCMYTVLLNFNLMKNLREFRWRQGIPKHLLVPVKKATGLRKAETPPTRPPPGAVPTALYAPRLPSGLWSRGLPSPPCHLCGLAVLGTPVSRGARYTPGGPPALAGPAGTTHGQCSQFITTHERLQSRCF